MPGYLQNVTGGWVGCMYGYYQTTPPDPETSNLWQKWWCYEKRSPQCADSEFGQSVSGGLWPCGNGFITDPANSNCPLLSNGSEEGLGNMSYFEQWDVRGGNSSQKYIRGQCRDSNGTPIGGAEVHCFVSATEFLESITFSDSNGNFMCACPSFPSVAHYLVAYDASGVRAGTTVNTLIPTWANGT